jgi:hypothetical protein
MQTFTRLLPLFLAAVLATGCYGPKQARQSYVTEHTITDDRARQAILDGCIYPGFPAVHIQGAIGRPTRVNTTTYQGGRAEQWVYRFNRATYVYVRNGEVTAIQNRGGATLRCK